MPSRFSVARSRLARRFSRRRFFSSRRCELLTAASSLMKAGIIEQPHSQGQGSLLTKKPSRILHVNLPKHIVRQADALQQRGFGSIRFAREIRIGDGARPCQVLSHSGRWHQ